MRAVALLLLVLTGSTVASAAAAAGPVYANPAFVPFTSVQDVCKACPGGPHFDKIKLRSGATIRAYVAAENPDFYFLVRFGEFRVVGRPRVASITRNPSPDKLPSYPDQILFKNGSVVAGTLRPPPANPKQFFITVPPENQIHSGSYNVIDELFRGGKLAYSARAGKKKKKKK